MGGRLLEDVEVGREAETKEKERSRREVDGEAKRDKRRNGRKSARGTSRAKSCDMERQESH